MSTARSDGMAHLRPDVTPQAVEALRLAAENMPISRPGQPWAGAADWLRRRARAFEVALRDAEQSSPLDLCRHGSAAGVCPSCAACAGCRGECGTCPYVTPPP